MAGPDKNQSHSTRPFSPTTVLPLPHQKKRTWWWFGLGGAGLLGCAAIFIILSLSVYKRAKETAATLPATAGAVIGSAGPVQQPTGGPAQQTAIVFTPTAAPVTPTPQPAAATLTTAPTDTPPAQLGPICFKAVADGSLSAACGTDFPPTVVEIHAIFDYGGMQPERQQWTRIWYHNGSQVLKVQEKWTGDVDGQFDYNLNTTDGQPFSVGTWELELYVDGNLQTYGAFVVNLPATPTSPPPENTPLPQPQPYRLAFTKWDGSKHSVWTAKLDGSEQRFLLDFAASPVWSAAGRRLAFYGEEGIDTQAAIAGGTNGIWVMGGEGESPAQLLPEGSTHTLDWSSTGLIAFDGARGGPDRRIYFIDAAGIPQPGEILGEQPSFSPDGRQVATKVCRPECGLWLVNADGSAPRQLTTEGSDGLPAWSPDGQKIAFSRNVDGNVDIYLIRVDGAGLTRLTTAPGTDSVPAWAPDGRQLVFRTTRNGIWQIFLMNHDGSNQHLIIDNVGASDEWAFDRMSVK